MANLTATLKLSLTYTGPGDESVSVPTEVVQCPYQSQIAGTIDVPDATASSTSLSIPFGTISKPTLVMIENRTGQELDVKINGAAAASHTLPDGAHMVPLAADDKATGTSITSLALITTALQSGAGLIAYRIFGDPTP
jgi:hypothetical protein